MAVNTTVGGMHALPGGNFRCLAFCPILVIGFLVFLNNMNICILKNCNCNQLFLYSACLQHADLSIPDPPFLMKRFVCKALNVAQPTNVLSPESKLRICINCPEVCSGGYFIRIFITVTNLLDQSITI